LTGNLLVEIIKLPEIYKKDSLNIITVVLFETKRAKVQQIPSIYIYIYIKRTQIMAFKGTEPMRSKIAIVNMILEQVNIFTHLGRNISYQEEKDIHSKITIFLQILGLLNNTLKPNLVQRSTRLKLYKTLALLTLLHGSEIWTIKQCDKNRLRTAEMKYLRRTEGYTLLNHKRNEKIVEELHLTLLEEKLCT
jgi:hypothetical protein